MWGLLVFSPDLEFVVIPSFSPCKSVLVDVVKKKVVEEPKVSRVVDVKALVGLQVSKEVLPLATKPFSNIIPDPFNPAVMNTPGMAKYKYDITQNRTNQQTFPIYKNLFLPLGSLPSTRPLSHSQYHGPLLLGLEFHELRYNEGRA